MAGNRANRAIMLGMISLCCTTFGYQRLLAADVGFAETVATPEPEGMKALHPLPAPPVDDDSVSSSPQHAEPSGNGACGDCSQNSGCNSSGCSSSGCNSSGCNSCWNGSCMAGPSGRLWVQADYMLWWDRGAHVPFLVTTSPAGTPRDLAGVLNSNTTTSLFGNTQVDGGSRSGFRISAGYWVNCCRTVGLQADYFDSGGRSTDFTASSDSAGSPILARPFTDISTGTPVNVSELVSFPNVLAGSVSVHVDDDFQSAGVALRANLLCHQPCCDDCGDGCESCGNWVNWGKRGFRVDFLGGYRHYSLSDGVDIQENLVSIDQGGLTPVGTTFVIEDSFRTRNEFHGGELGLDAQLERGPWTLEFIVKLALGNNRESATLRGSDVQTVPSNPADVATFPSGIFVNDTQGFNGGDHFRDVFTVIPEFEAQISRQLTSHLRARLGYNFLYWYHVARAGDQINTTLNQSYFPGILGASPTGPVAPTFQWNSSNFLAQGMNAGLEFRY